METTNEERGKQFVSIIDVQPFVEDGVKTVYINRLGALREVRPLKQRFYFDSNNMVHSVLDCKDSEGGEFRGIPLSEVYQSVIEFDAGHSVLYQQICSSSYHIMPDSAIDNVSVVSRIFKEYGILYPNVDCSFYQIQNGMLMKKFFVEEFGIERGLYYDYSDGKFKHEKLDNTVKIYKTRHECLADNVYTVIDENGERTERVGIAKFLELDDEQKGLVEEWKRLLKKMEDAKMKIVADCCGCFEVYNFKQVENYRFDFDAEPDENEEVAYRGNARYALYCGDIDIWSEDYELVIERKK